jgi:hypothetical protein
LKDAEHTQQTVKTVKPISTPLAAIPEAKIRQTRNNSSILSKKSDLSRAQDDSIDGISVTRLPALRQKKSLFAEEIKDYSHLFSSFYDVFAQFQVLGAKEFDMQCVRDVRSMLATVTVLMAGV